MPIGLPAARKDFDQLDRVLVFGEIPHRPVAAGVENAVEVLLPDAVKANGLVELRFRGCVLLEPQCQVSADVRFVALVLPPNSALRARPNVCYEGQLGKHMLALSSSQFDPTRK